MWIAQDKHELRYQQIVHRAIPPFPSHGKSGSKQRRKCAIEERGDCAEKKDFLVGDRRDTIDLDLSEGLCSAIPTARAPVSHFAIR